MYFVGEINNLNSLKIKLSNSNRQPLLPLYFLLLITIQNIIIIKAEQSSDLFNTILVYKCLGSKLSSGYDINIPSYHFSSQVVLRIKQEPFPGCKSLTLPQENFENGTEVELFFRQSEEEELERRELLHIEANEVTISPSGFLNVAGHFYDPEDYCVVNYTPAENETELPSLRLEYCPVNCSNSGQSGSVLCVQKCCSVGKVLDLWNGTHRCEPSGNKSWTGFFYDEQSWKRASKNGGEGEGGKVHYFKKPMSQTCNGSGFEPWFDRKLENKIHVRTRLLTSGQFIYVSAHRVWELLESKFCIDGIQNFGEVKSFYSGDEVDQVIFNCKTEFLDKGSEDVSVLYMYSLFSASVFYLITAIIYALLWETQNTHGWTTFSLVVSQCFLCFFIGNAHRLGINKESGTRNSILCISNAILAHFFILASFTWLTVINFDLWSTFRSLRARNRKRVNWKKFFCYSAFGWGGPLIVVIVGVTLNHLFPNRDSFVLVPEYGSNICYVISWAQGVYIYYIAAVLLGITLTFSFLSCVKIYKYTMEVAGARASSSAENQKILRVYAKLSVVLGTSWIFEFISWVASPEDHQHWIWTILDMYNLLTAVFVFVLFACKRSNFKELLQKYSSIRPINNLIERWMSTNSSNVTASSGLSAQVSGGQEMKNIGKDNSGFQATRSELT